MALLEEGDSRCSPSHRQRRAAVMMRKTSGHLRSVRLAAIATAISMSTTGHFDEVIAKIDEMISTLAEKEAEIVELHKKIKDAIEQITQLERELAAAKENR